MVISGIGRAPALGDAMAAPAGALRGLRQAAAGRSSTIAACHAAGAVCRLSLATRQAVRTVRSIRAPDPTDANELPGSCDF